MKKSLLSLAVISTLFSSLFADDLADMKAEIEALNKKVINLEKKQNRTNKTLSEVKSHDAFDNVKFGIDFRNAVDVLEYKYNNYTIPAYKDSLGVLQPAENISGTKASNPSLITSRLYLTMASSPMDGLIFKGKLAIYSTWGSHLYVTDSALKDWAASSKPADTVMRVKEAYFVYSNQLGSQPISFSIGRRQSTNGFLANYRENEKDSGSPSAHTTNMEVNGAMVRLDWGRFINGAYTKFVYGRAHNGDMENVYSSGAGIPFGPYAETSSEDDSVDFFVMPGDAYSNGQYEVMYQWAHIFNTKGKNETISTNNTAVAAGSADFLSLSLKVNGIGDEINDFLDATTLFASGAMTTYNPKEGYSLLGSTESKTGYSLWAGALVPDGFTNAGKFGVEYNKGSAYWTPMTWAEDTAIGSKIAVRGNAYEAYWNFDLFGVKYLPSQIRYTYVQHDYTPNVNCAGWVPVEKVDITASDLRFAVSYRY